MGKSKSPFKPIKGSQLENNDVIVFSIDTYASDQQIEEIQKKLEKLFPYNKILITNENFSVNKLRPAAENEIKKWIQKEFDKMDLKNKVINMITAMDLENKAIKIVNDLNLENRIEDMVKDLVKRKIIEIAGAEINRYTRKRIKSTIKRKNKLTDRDVREIRRLAESGKDAKSIAKLFNLNTTYTSMIIRKIARDDVK